MHTCMIVSHDDETAVYSLRTLIQGWNDRCWQDVLYHRQSGLVASVNSFAVAASE